MEKESTYKLDFVIQIITITSIVKVCTKAKWPIQL